MITEPPKYNREQIKYIIELIVVSAIDVITDGMPNYIDYKTRIKHSDDGLDAGRLNKYERACLHTTGMNMSILFAQVSGDGIGVADSLEVSGLLESVENWVKKAWENQGKNIKKQIVTGKSYVVEDLYENFPDCEKIAEEFTTLFDEFLTPAKGT